MTGFDKAVDVRFLPLGRETDRKLRLQRIAGGIFQRKVQRGSYDRGIAEIGDQIVAYTEKQQGFGAMPALEAGIDLLDIFGIHHLLNKFKPVTPIYEKSGTSVSVSDDYTKKSIKPFKARQIYIIYRNMQLLFMAFLSAGTIFILIDLVLVHDKGGELFEGFNGLLGACARLPAGNGEINRDIRVERRGDTAHEDIADKDLVEAPVELALIRSRNPHGRVRGQDAREILEERYHNLADIVRLFSRLAPGAVIGMDKGPVVSVGPGIIPVDEVADYFFNAGYNQIFSI